MTERRPASEYRIRCEQLDDEHSLHVRHPLNQKSEIHMTRLSDPTGLRNIGVSLARLPPGRESFALHVHSRQEEWIYVLSGVGVVRLDEEELDIKAGDFVGFPAGGPAHLLCNRSGSDLVYLQGGDRKPGDRGYFPDLDMIAYQHDDGQMALIPRRHVELRPFSDWMPTKRESQSETK